MKRVNVDSAAASVKKFLLALPATPNGVELALNSRIIGTFVPGSKLGQGEQSALVARGRELVQRARERNKGVPARVLEQEVRKALAEVRARRRK